MYTYLNFLDSGLNLYSVLGNPWRLCYISKIPETILGYTPESEKIMSEPGYDWRTDMWKVRSIEIPNPDFSKGASEFEAYFTTRFSDQWGDDWDDAPYEYNAGSPYDTDYRKTREEYEILVVRFGWPEEIWWGRMPCDYTGYNSPWSVQDINSGAVSWLYLVSEKTGQRQSIQGGCGLSEFLKTIKSLFPQSYGQVNPQ